MTLVSELTTLFSTLQKIQSSSGAPGGFSLRPLVRYTPTSPPSTLSSTHWPTHDPPFPFSRDRLIAVPSLRGLQRLSTYCSSCHPTRSSSSSIRDREKSPAEASSFSESRDAVSDFPALTRRHERRVCQRQEKPEDRLVERRDALRTFCLLR